jgi:hypothetical protein
MYHTTSRFGEERAEHADLVEAIRHAFEYEHLVFDEDDYVVFDPDDPQLFVEPLRKQGVHLFIKDGKWTVEKSSNHGETSDQTTEEERSINDMNVHASIREWSNWFDEAYGKKDTVAMEKMFDRMEKEISKAFHQHPLDVATIASARAKIAGTRGYGQKSSNPTEKTSPSWIPTGKFENPYRSADKPMLGLKSVFASLPLETMEKVWSGVIDLEGSWGYIQDYIDDLEIKEKLMASPQFYSLLKTWITQETEKAKKRYPGQALTTINENVFRDFHYDYQGIIEEARKRKSTASPGSTGEATPEWRMNRLGLEQGHYFTGYMSTAIDEAKDEAMKTKDVIVIQKWRPRGEKYIVVPPNFPADERAIIDYYTKKGYNAANAMQGGILTAIGRQTTKEMMKEAMEKTPAAGGRYTECLVKIKNSTRTEDIYKVRDELKQEFVKGDMTLDDWNVIDKSIGERLDELRRRK